MVSVIQIVVYIGLCAGFSIMVGLVVRGAVLRRRHNRQRALGIGDEEEEAAQNEVASGGGTGQRLYNTGTGHECPRRGSVDSTLPIYAPPAEPLQVQPLQLGSEPNLPPPYSPTDPERPEMGPQKPLAALVRNR